MHPFLKKIPKIVWIALLTFVVGRAFSYAPALTEKVYSQGIYTFITRLLSNFSALFPFSLDDLCYTLLLLFFLLMLVMVLVKKIRKKKGFLIMGKTLLWVYILFYWLWGFNYYRQPLSKRIAQEMVPVDSVLFYETLTQIIHETNRNYCSFDKNYKKISDQAIERSYLEMETKLSSYQMAGKRRPKNITFSRFFSGATVFGYFGPFAHETHVNKQLLPIQYPFVLAHEKAHQMGITSEAEANFMAWLVCNNSSLCELKYSANLFVLIHFIRAIPEKSNREAVLNQLRPEVMEQLENSRIYWQALRIQLIDQIQTKLYHWYLKGNEIPEGIHNYQEVVTYICNYKNRLPVEFIPTSNKRVN